VQQAFPLDAGGVEFGSAAIDVRRYYRLAGEYVVAMRGMMSTSWGSDPQEVQLGGPNSIRGQARQSIRGRNAALFTLEYRYPFLDYVKFGWPLRSAFGGVRGDLFLDVGTAFDDPATARLTGPNEDGRNALRDLHIGFGVGARARIAFFPIRIDAGWPTDGVSVGKPVWHFAIGPEF
jgi:outer membrane protein assembly factor BamA